MDGIIVRYFLNIYPTSLFNNRGQRGWYHCKIFFEYLPYIALFITKVNVDGIIVRFQIFLKYHFVFCCPGNLVYNFVMLMQISFSYLRI